MSDGVIKILDKLGEKFGLAIDWSSQNIIPYLQELMGRYINLCNAKAITWIVLCFICIILSVIELIKLFKWSNSKEFGKDYDNEEDFCFLLFILVLVIAVQLAVVLFNVFGLYANIFTPELVFLDYIKSMGGGI